MATIKMDDLRNSEIGRAFNAQEMARKQQGETKAMVGRRDKRTMAASEILIKRFILGAEEPVSMLQICDSIGRKPAPHFRAIVDELVRTGQVAKAQDTSIGGNLPKYWYWRP